MSEPTRYSRQQILGFIRSAKKDLRKEYGNRNVRFGDWTILVSNKGATLQLYYAVDDGTRWSDRYHNTAL